MDLQHVLAALRQRWYIPLIAVAVTLLLAAGWMAYQTPMYRATAQAFVSTSTAASEQSGGAYQSAMFAQNRVATYAQLITSPQVLDSVAAELQLPDGPRSLGSAVTATNPPQTVLLEVTATNPSPAQAAAVANSAATHLATTIEALERPSDQSHSPIKVTVSKPANTPTAPYFPNPTTTLGLALLLGLGAGVGIALLRDQLDTSIKRSSDLAELSGATPLGVIAFDPDAEKEPLGALNPQSRRSEAFRTIRTNLQYVDVDNPPRVVAVTSSMPAEGKTTAACNVAITMAQTGLRVCLVEADLRRPRVAEYLGIDSVVGLTDVLAGKMPLAQALLPWNRYLLTVLPSGAIPPNPSELLSSQQMRTTLAQLRAEFDVVIVDSAPLLAVADGSITAAAADGAILIVRHGRTTVDQMTKALAALAQVDARLLGTVLTFAPVKRRANAYDYGYGYGYGSGPGGSADATSRRAKGRRSRRRARSRPRGEPFDLHQRLAADSEVAAGNEPDGSGELHPGRFDPAPDDSGYPVEPVQAAPGRVQVDLRQPSAHPGPPQSAVPAPTGPVPRHDQEAGRPW